MLLTVLSIQRQALSDRMTAKEARSLTLSERHRPDLFFQGNCQTCFHEAGSEATFLGASPTCVSYQTFYLLPSTCESRWSFTFQLKRRAGWAAVLSSYKVVSLDFNSEVLFVIIVPVLILQVICIPLKEGSFFILHHFFFCP